MNSTTITSEVQAIVTEYAEGITRAEIAVLCSSTKAQAAAAISWLIRVKAIAYKGDRLVATPETDQRSHTMAHFPLGTTKDRQPGYHRKNSYMPVVEANETAPTAPTPTPAPAPAKKRARVAKKIITPLMPARMHRWECKNCNHIVNDDELLAATNPFDADDVIYGCPNCKSIEGFHNICDEPGCRQHAGCGWPSPTGYRRTCYEHGKAAFK